MLGDAVRVAAREFGDRPALLLQQDLLVAGLVDGGEHAHRNGEVGEPEIGQHLGGVNVLLVVDPECPLAHLPGGHHARGDAVHDDGVPPVGRTEQQRPAVL